jgi:spermidine synthase
MGVFHFGAMPCASMTRPWVSVEQVDTPDGELVLRRRGETDFLITIRGRVLMTSAMHRSEVALAKWGCAGLRETKGARVLVSGLGMGFTLRAALDELPACAEIVVAELNPVVAQWCEGPLGAITNNAASDPRVSVQIIDVAKLLEQTAVDARARRFDAIVLDMYEGPHMRVHPNDPLYGPRAVMRAQKALSKSGTLAVWCEGKSTGFERALGDAGFRFSLEREGRGARLHHVYVARNA